ncbi:G-protein coupled receptor 151-like [Corythoichthys intestinalis]|uniref:G-protein coupled receptor 151-like n=1 Tax=Corythoichthys intestinalis TaxID=161448 RepID=UPI0025A58885|nr:G-protein coupled receptor 151-like [Corythoichthys intestinalis]XP_061796169.1 G-protein coupled receptor 151-like [Nerophis lumbriciformis]
MEADPNATFVDSAGGLQLLGVGVDGEELRSAAPVLLLGACASGTAGNLLALLVLAREFRAGRGSEAKAVLASVASADALLLLLCAPVRALAAYKQAWVLGRFACATADWFQHSCLVAKTLLLAIGTRADHTPRRDGPQRGGWILWAVASAWLLSMMLPVPQMLFAALQTRGAAHAAQVCVWQAPACASHFMALFYKIYPAAAYAGPVLFALAYYTAILHRALNGAPCPRRRSEVTLVLLCLSATQGLLLLPEWGAFTWVRLGYRQPPAGVFLCAQVLVYACAALSPALLLAMYDDLRRGLFGLCATAACHPRRRGDPKATEGNGAGLQGDGAAAADGEKTFPDVEHFWTGRRNTQVEEEQDPIPWERDEKML